MSFGDSCAVIPVFTIRSGVGRSSQLFFSLSHINGPLIGVAWIVLSIGKGGNEGSARSTYRIKNRIDLQKGGYAGSRRRTVIGLDLILGLTPKKCGRE